MTSFTTASIQRISFRIAITSLFILSVIFSGNAQMRQVFRDQINEFIDIEKLSFYSPSAGFVAFDQYIGFTTDSGRTFTNKYITSSNVLYGSFPVNLTINFHIAGVKAFNQNTIIVYGDYGSTPAILYSTNGGNSFSLIHYEKYDAFQAVDGIPDMNFPENGNIGFAVDYNRILRTANGGQSWSVVFTDAGRKFSNLVGVNNNMVLAYSTEGNGKLYKGTNNGTAWQPVVLPVGRLLGATFLTAAMGWVNMDDKGVYITTDGGASWNLQNDRSVTPFTGSKLKFINDTTGYALGNGYTFYKTTDGGKIWEPLQRDNDFAGVGGGAHNDLQAIGADQVWAGGDHSFLELTTNGGGTPIPKAFFRIDTTDQHTTVVVRLINYSKPGYTCKWYKDGQLISTAFNATYTHTLGDGVEDYIQLIVSNGVETASANGYVAFNSPATITSFTPVTAAAYKEVTITGKEFATATAVSFGGVPAINFTIVSPTTIKAMTGNGASGNVTVVTATRGTATLPGFTFIPAPSITSFSPLSATAGTTITITGVNFTGVNAVKFDGIPATSFTVVSPTSITAVVPSGTSGYVEVFSPSGEGSLGGFISLPAFTAFAPAIGTQGTALTIEGTSLGATTAIRIGGVPVKSFTLHSSTRITAIVNTGSSGQVELSGSTGTVGLPGFTYVQAPAVTGFSPLRGPVGTTVTITGSDFDAVPANNIVFFGGVRATVTGGTATSLTVAVPAGAGMAPVSVTSRKLTAFAAQSFGVTYSPTADLTPASFENKSSIQLQGLTGMTVDLATGDLDGDGKADLAVTNGEGLCIFRNTGTSNTISFDAKKVFPANGPISISDLNGDGLLDVAVLKDSRYLVLFRNISSVGNISFADMDTITAIEPLQMAESIAIGDIDRDGKPDIVVGYRTDNSYVTVYRNNSYGSDLDFSAVLQIPNFALNIIVQDVDGDGKKDLVTAAYGVGNIFIFKNTSEPGMVSFASSVNIPVEQPYAISTADIDGDGKPDIVSTDANSQKIVVFRNTGSAGAISFVNHNTWNAPVFRKRPTLADIDGDTKADLLVAQNFNYLAVYKNTSSLSNPLFNTPVLYGASGYLEGDYKVLVQDLNGDGRPEAIVGQQYPSTISALEKYVVILENKVIPGPYVSSFAPEIAATGDVVTIKGRYFAGTNAVQFGGTSAASFTVVNDTTITAVVAGGASGSVSVTNQYSTSERTGFVFGKIPVISSVVPLSGPIGSTVTITGSGFSNVVTENIVYLGGRIAPVTAASATTLTVVVPDHTSPQPISVTSRGLTAHFLQPFNVTYPGGGARMVAASFISKGYWGSSGAGRGTICDMDGNGTLDIIGGTRQFDQKQFNVTLFGSYTGELSDSYFTGGVVGVPAGNIVTNLAVGDLDGDGKKDVVAVTPNSIGLFRNICTPGNVSFQQPVVYSAGATSYLHIADPFIIDLDGDGKPEVVVPHPETKTICIYKNRSNLGQLALDTALVINTAVALTDMTMADIDGDGRPDIVAARGNDGTAIYPNTTIGSGISFGSLLLWQHGAISIKTGDIDGDGKADVVMGFAPMGIMRNTSTPGNFSFAPALDIEIGSDRIALGDLDGDGKIDIAGGNGCRIIKNVSVPGTILLRNPFKYGANGMSVSGICVSIGDMSADGKPDIVLIGGSYLGFGGDIAIFTNYTDTNLVDVATCSNVSLTLQSGLTGRFYQWQVNDGSGFRNIYPDRTEFTGCWEANLTIKNIPDSWNGYSFRCLGENLDTSKVFSPDMGGAGNAPAVSIATPSFEVCAGAPTTFTATTANITNPSYQWQIGGVNVGTNSSTFTTTFQGNRIVQVIVTGSSACAATVSATSNSLEMWVNASVAPSVSATASVASVCEGAPVTFTAQPVNGGLTPVYQWQKNGVNVGANSATYVAQGLLAGDKIQVIMTSNAFCAVPPTDTSDIVNISINPVVTPVITISGDTSIGADDVARVTATFTGGGTAPRFQWQDSTQDHGWQDIFMASRPIADVGYFGNGSKVRCRMVSNDPCITISTVFSNVLTFIVDNSGGRIVANPVANTLVIEGLYLGEQWEVLEIWSLSTGNKVLTENIANQSRVSIPVGQLSKGMYAAVLKSRYGHIKSMRFLKM